VKYAATFSLLIYISCTKPNGTDIPVGNHKYIKNEEKKPIELARKYFYDCYENVENVVLNNRVEIINTYRGGGGNRCYYWLYRYYELKGDKLLALKYRDLNQNQYYYDLNYPRSYNKEDFNELILHCNNGDFLSCITCAVYSQDKLEKFKYTMLAIDNKMNCYGIYFANVVDMLSKLAAQKIEMRLQAECKENAGAACSEYGRIYYQKGFKYLEESSFQTVLGFLSFVCKNGSKELYCDLIDEHCRIIKTDCNIYRSVFLENEKNWKPENYYRKCHLGSVK
jgi:hypothetical protein